MVKIKLNLASGTVTEKPLINAFSADNNTYVVLDNEMNGSMGLPIILVSKLQDNKLVKITDQTEWQQVKEHLKNIIAGNKVDFIKISNEITADDIYYTQLTLPVSSFDALKNVYPFKEEEPVEAGPIAEAINGAPEEAAPVVEPVPMPEVSVAEPSVEVTPTIEPSAEPAIPEAPVSVEPVANINTPLVDINIPSMAEATNEVAPVVEPTIPSVEASVEPTPVTETTPEPEVNLDNPLLNDLNNIVPEANAAKEEKELITPTPIIDSPLDNASANDTSIVSESKFADQKEAFMQACENMFDALVQKFEKELEKK